MLGLGSLKDKIANLGEGLKSQFSVEVEPVSAESDLTAGSAVLTHYQACWREIHSRARAAGKEADRCDRCVNYVTTGAVKDSLCGNLTQMKL